MRVFPGCWTISTRRRSLYAYLRERLGCGSPRPKERIETVLATPREALLIGTSPALPMLLMNRVSRDDAGRPIERVRGSIAATASASPPCCGNPSPATWLGDQECALSKVDQEPVTFLINNAGAPHGDRAKGQARSTSVFSPRTPVRARLTPVLAIMAAGSAVADDPGSTVGWTVTFGDWRRSALDPLPASGSFSRPVSTIRRPAAGKGPGEREIWAGSARGGVCLQHRFRGLARLDPAYGEVGASLGARPSRVLWRIRLPLLLPSIAAAASLAVALCMGEVGATIMVYPASWRTLPVSVLRADRSRQPVPRRCRHGRAGWR